MVQGVCSCGRAALGVKLCVRIVVAGLDVRCGVEFRVAMIGVMVASTIEREPVW